MAQAATQAVVFAPPHNISPLDCHLRLLYSLVGTPHCLFCRSAIEPQSTWEIAARLATLPPGTEFELFLPFAKHQDADPKVGMHAFRALQAPEEDERADF